MEWEPIQMVHRKCCFRSCPTTVLSVTSGGTNSGDHFYFKLMAHLSDFNIISRMLKVIFPNIFSKSILCFTYFNFHLFIKCLNVVGRKHPLFAVCVTLHSLSCIFFFSLFEVHGSAHTRQFEKSANSMLQLLFHAYYPTSIFALSYDNFFTFYRLVFSET